MLKEWSLNSLINLLQELWTVEPLELDSLGEPDKPELTDFAAADEQDFGL